MKEPPIYIDTQAFLRASRRAQNIEAVGIVPSLLAYGNNGSFVWEPTRIAAYLSSAVRPISSDQLEAMVPAFRNFFVEVRPNVWAPSPRVFSMVDGNEGARS